MPKDAIWVRDVTQSNTTWGNRIFPVYSPHQSVFPVGAGIGQGLSLGTRRRRRGERPQDRGDDRRRRLLPQCRRAVDRGAGEARPQRHRDERPRLWRDQAHPGRDAQGRRFFADLQGPDLGQLAALAGIPFWKVQSADAFGATVEKSIAHKGPSLVEVDMTAVGEFPAYYPFNQRPAA